VRQGNATALHKPPFVRHELSLLACSAMSWDARAPTRGRQVYAWRSTAVSEAHASGPDDWDPCCVASAGRLERGPGGGRGERWPGLNTVVIGVAASGYLHARGFFGAAALGLEPPLGARIAEMPERRFRRRAGGPATAIARCGCRSRSTGFLDVGHKRWVASGRPPAEARCAAAPSDGGNYPLIDVVLPDFDALWPRPSPASYS
jgi:hypothetical protein